MKEKIKQLNLEYKAALFNGIVLACLMLVLLFFYFINLQEIPNGIALGMLICTVTYVLMGILSRPSKSSTIGIIIVTVLRFLLMAGAIVLSCVLYYKNNLHIFNVFAVVGGYTISIIVYAILYLKEKGKDGLQ